MGASCAIDKVPEKRVFLGSPNPSRHREMAEEEEEEKGASKHKNIVAAVVFLLSSAFFIQSRNKVSFILLRSQW